jgi:hypothetical protein
MCHADSRPAGREADSAARLNSLRSDVARPAAVDETARCDKTQHGQHDPTWPDCHFLQEEMMTSTAVLALGLDPRFADFNAMPQLTPELIRAYIDAEIARVRKLGFEVETRLIAPGEAETEIEAALRARRFACVVIGAGLREPPQHLLLFEKVLNLVHHLAPDASIVFNSTPADTAEAVLRWVRPLQERH